MNPRTSISAVAMLIYGLAGNPSANATSSEERNQQLATELSRLKEFHSARDASLRYAVGVLEQLSILGISGISSDEARQERLTAFDPQRKVILQRGSLQAREGLKLVERAIEYVGRSLGKRDGDGPIRWTDPMLNKIIGLAADEQNPDVAVRALKDALIGYITIIVAETPSVP